MYNIEVASPYLSDCSRFSRPFDSTPPSFVKIPNPALPFGQCIMYKGEIQRAKVQASNLAKAGKSNIFCAVITKFAFTTFALKIWSAGLLRDQLACDAFFRLHHFA